MSSIKFTQPNNEVVAFSANNGSKQIDTHGGYNGVTSGYSMFSGEHIKLVSLLKKLSLKVSVTYASSFTVPVSGIYQIASQTASGGISNCSVGIHSFKAGDVIPVKSYGKTSIHRIQ